MNAELFFYTTATLLFINLIWGYIKTGKVDFLIYKSDPRGHSPFSIFASITGTIVGGGMFLAVGQIGHEAGIVGYIVGLSYLFGLLLFGIFASSIKQVLESERAKSLTDLIFIAFDSRTARAFSFVSLAIYFFLLSGQFVALIDFTRFFLANGVPEHYLILLVLFAVVMMLIYPLVGGLRKDIATDVFQVMLILVVSIIVSVGFFAETTVSETLSHLQPIQLSGTAYGSLFTIGVLIFITPSFFVRQDMWQRVTAMTDSSKQWVPFAAAGAVSFLFYGFFTTLGMWAFSEGITSSHNATFEILFQKWAQNPYVLGLIMSGFFAAILSSADTFINNASIFVTEALHHTLDDRKKLRYSRLYGALSVIFALCIAYAWRDMVDLFVGAMSLILIFSPLIAACFVPEWRNKTASFWSICAGVTVFTASFGLWSAKMAFAPAVFSSITSYIILSVIFREKKA